MQDFAVGLFANACHLGVVLDFASLTPERRKRRLVAHLLVLALPLYSLLEIRNRSAFHLGLAVIPVCLGLKVLLRMRDQPIKGLQSAIQWTALFLACNTGLLVFRALN